MDNPSFVLSVLPPIIKRTFYKTISKWVRSGVEYHSLLFHALVRNKRSKVTASLTHLQVIRVDETNLSILFVRPFCPMTVSQVVRQNGYDETRNEIRVSSLLL